MKRVNFAIVSGYEVNRAWKRFGYRPLEQLFVRCRKDGTYNLNENTSIYEGLELMKAMARGNKLNIWKADELIIKEGRSN